MDLLTQLQQDRANLLAGLEQMQVQFEQMGRRVQQQSGAIQYVEMLIERVRKEQNGDTPPAGLPPSTPPQEPPSGAPGAEPPA